MMASGINPSMADAMLLLTAAAASAKSLEPHSRMAYPAPNQPYHTLPAVRRVGSGVVPLTPTLKPEFRNDETMAIMMGALKHRKAEAAREAARPSKGPRSKRAVKRTFSEDFDYSDEPQHDRPHKKTAEISGYHKVYMPSINKVQVHQHLTAGGAPSTSAAAVTYDQISPDAALEHVGEECEWNDTLLSLGTKELNEVLRQGDYTSAQIQNLKAARRRAKNRTYALRSRQKKGGKNQTPCPGPERA